MSNYIIVLWAMVALAAFVALNSRNIYTSSRAYAVAAVRDTRRSTHGQFIVSKRIRAIASRPEHRLYSAAVSGKGFNRPQITVDWGSKRFSSAGTTVPASKNKPEHRTQSAYRRWFLDLFAGEWSLDVLKFKDDSIELKDYAAHLRQSDYQFIHDDSLTVVKVSQSLPIWILQAIGKVDKRLSRLFGEMMFGALFNRSEVTVKNLKLSEVGRAAFDGMFAKMSIELYEAVVAQTLSRLNGRAYKIVKRNASRIREELKAGHKVRLYATTLTGTGEGKGHAIIDPAIDGMTLILVDEKKEVRFDDAHQDLLYVAFNEVHSSQLWLDIQTVGMHGSDGRYMAVMDDVKAFFSNALEEIRSGIFDAKMSASFERGFEDRGVAVSEGWWLAEYCYSGGGAGWFSTTARAAVDTILKQAIRQHNGRRLPIFGQRRYYICNDYSYGNSVPRGHFVLDGVSIIVNALDWITADQRFNTLHDLTEWVNAGGDLSALPNGIGAILGGADMDDLIALLKRIAADGRIVYDVTRSPTFVGEIVQYVCEIGAGLDYEGGEIVWPTALPPMPGLDESKRLHIEGRDWKSMLSAIKTLMDLGSPVGAGAKDSRFSVVNTGRLPEGMLAAMSDLVDEVVQFFNVDAKRASEFHIEHIEKMVEGSLSGQPFSYYMADEILEMLPEGTMINVAERGQTGYPAEWYDALMDAYSEILNEFVQEANDLIATAYPPTEFMQAAKKYEPPARLFRQFYGQLFGEDRQEVKPLHFDENSKPVVKNDDDKANESSFFANLAASCEDFLNNYPDEERPGIVAAAVAIAYGKSAGDEPVKDFVGWQRASSKEVADREGAIFDYMMRFLREKSIIDQPTVEVDAVSGRERLVRSELGIDNGRYHVPMFGAWAYMNGLDPNDREAKARKAELLEGDYQAEMVDMVFRVSHEEYTNKAGERIRRGVAIDTDSGEVMGTMPARFDSDGLPVLSRVITTFEYDGKLVAVCEDATE